MISVVCECIGLDHCSEWLATEVVVGGDEQVAVLPFERLRHLVSHFAFFGLRCSHSIGHQLSNPAVNAIGANENAPLDRGSLDCGHNDAVGGFFVRFDALTLSNFTSRLVLQTILYTLKELWPVHKIGGLSNPGGCQPVSPLGSRRIGWLTRRRAHSLLPKNIEFIGSNEHLHLLVRVMTDGQGESILSYCLPHPKLVQDMARAGHDKDRLALRRSDVPFFEQHKVNSAPLECKGKSETRNAATCDYDPEPFRGARAARRGTSIRVGHCWFDTIMKCLRNGRELGRY